VSLPTRIYAAQNRDQKKGQKLLSRGGMKWGKKGKQGREERKADTHEVEGPRNMGLCEGGAIIVRKKKRKRRLESMWRKNVKLGKGACRDAQFQKRKGKRGDREKKNAEPKGTERGVQAGKGELK